MFGYFYNQSLRKLVIGFGTLFNNISVDHSNPDGGNDLNIRVPITYASQEKFIRRFLEPSSINDGLRIENQLPRMSYIMTNIQPDPSRRRNVNSPSFTRTTANCSDKPMIISEEVPVNIGFSLFIYTRHIDDTLQIVEQIMPYFNPQHIITMDLNEAKPGINIPITMTSNSISERYDGDLSTRRINISSFNFIAKSYVYGKVQGNNTILDSVTVRGLTAGIAFGLEG
jgi:hypothetical protein